VPDALQPELDALFALKPDAMVDARNALAARLKKAGDATGAATVKALKRPSPAAWALNQLHFEASPLLARALEASEHMRALHARDGVDADALRAAFATQRSAITALVDAALARCEAEGLPHGLAQQKKLLATVQGLLAGAGDEPLGRMTHDLEPAGFDAVALVGTSAVRATVTASTKPAAATPAAVSEPARSDDAERIAEARAHVSALERRAREARALVQKQEAAGAEAEDMLARTRERVAEVEQKLLELRSKLREREAQAAEARSALAAAQQSANVVDARLAQAQDALSALTQPRKRTRGR
jgi:hypothetical protein